MKLWNIDFQSVGPAEFYFAETGEAGNMPAGRKGQRPVFQRSICRIIVRWYARRIRK